MGYDRPEFGWFEDLQVLPGRVVAPLRPLVAGERAGGVQRPDLLVVNPPRRGIGEQLATRIEASGVERVLYSSCNPRTLAADLAHLPSMRVVRSRLFDMFPHTEHAEVLVELVRD